MNVSDFRFGFRVLGGRDRDRKLVDWSAAFLAHLQDDERANNSQESYLSAFQFAGDFREHLQGTGTTKGFSGPTWAQWLWFDIDRDDIATALEDTIRLIVALEQRWNVSSESMLRFFSGSKGFHVGIPTALWTPQPDVNFHLICRHFAECLATLADVVIDAGVYDRVRLFRAPNSRHPRTGLHKRLIGFDELFQIQPAGILDAARHPQDAVLPEPPHVSDRAVSDWMDAARAAGSTTQRLQDRPTEQLNAATLALIRSGALQGDRHRMAYSAARNLADCKCPLDLIHSLLTPALRDAGLAPSDIRRQIECGVKDSGVSHG